MYRCTSKMQASPNPLAVYANMVVNEFHKASISKNQHCKYFMEKEAHSAHLLDLKKAHNGYE